MEHKSALRQACDNRDELFEKSTEDLLRMVYKEYPHDIDRLKRAYSVRNAPILDDITSSPSYIIYSENYDEVNRSLIGLLSLRWIHRGEFDTFVGSQPKEFRLSKKSFYWMRDFYRKTITNADSLYTLITAIVINDLGKDPQLTVEYFKKTGEDISNLNHDAIFQKTCEEGLIETLNKLPEQYKDDFLRGIKLGATFNFGQLAQTENAPACLTDLLDMRGNARSFELRYMEQLLDIAGAAGHQDWTCAQKLIQPIFDAYQTVYYACLKVIDGTSLREAYDSILIARANLLKEKGFSFSYDVKNKSDRALMRLMCMGGVANPERAQVFVDTWEKDLDEFDGSLKESLIRTLDIDGKKGEPAVQLTHMPTFLNRVNDTEHLCYTLQYCDRAMTAEGPSDESAVVIDRNLLNVVKEYAEEFHKNPAILQKADIPEGVVAQRV